MPPKKSPPATPATVRVYPEPSLPEGSFVPGLGADGAEVSPEQAAEWVAAGVATTTPPEQE